MLEIEIIKHTKRPFKNENFEFNIYAYITREDFEHTFFVFLAPYRTRVIATETSIEHLVLPKISSAHVADAISCLT